MLENTLKQKQREASFYQDLAKSIAQFWLVVWPMEVSWVGSSVELSPIYQLEYPIRIAW